ncbi:glycosyltransferase family 39 protein [Bifidobacterium colobi]|nr:glycosyltransferase family 39 protein [Bifidobacterium colobi]
MRDLTTTNSAGWLHRTTRYGTSFIAYLSLVIVSLLCIAALCFTFVFPKTYAETPLPSHVCAIVSSICSILLLLLWIHYQKWTIPEIKTHSVIRVVAAYSMIVGTLWSAIVNLPPVSDQLFVAWYGEQLAKHNYQPFLATYMQQFPHQNGYVLFYAGFGSLFGFSNWTAVRLFNAAMVAIALGSLLKLTEMMFASQRIVVICAVLCMAFLPFIFFSNFVYGNIPSVAFCLLACLMQQYASQTKKTSRLALYGIACALFLFIAIWFKPNGMIYLIGIEITWIALTLTTKKLMHSIAALACAILYVAASTLPTAIVSSQTGISFDKAEPKIAWIAIGMQDSPLAPGWYNPYFTEQYAQHNNDPEIVDQLAREVIRQRAEFFAQHPATALRFYAHKEITQWAEPTFESLWTVFGGQDSKALDKDSILQSSFHQGVLRAAYTLWCDIIQSLIYIGAAFALWMHRKHWKPEQLALILIVLGGFAFHTIWEAKSDYVLPYFILLLPYAAAGLLDLRTHGLPCLQLKHLTQSQRNKTMQHTNLD